MRLGETTKVVFLIKPVVPDNVRATFQFQSLTKLIVMTW